MMGDAAVTGATTMLTPPWWTNIVPGVGAGVYELYQGVKLVLAPGDPTPVLNVNNAVTGQLTPDQVAQIKQNAAEAITRASGGNPDLAQEQIAQVNNDIDSTLGSQGIPWWFWAGLAAVVFMVRR